MTRFDGDGARDVFGRDRGLVVVEGDAAIPGVSGPQRGVCPGWEVYLTAASRLGAPPNRCVVVEDAFAGVEGARSAGMHCIAVSRSGRHLPADVVVRSLDLLDAGVFDSLVADFSQGAR